MKRRMRLVLIVLGLVGFRLWAQPAPEKNEPVAQESSSMNELKRQEKYMVKFGTVGYNYEEPGVMKIHGRMYRVATQFRNAIGHGAKVPMWYSVDLGFAMGKQTYDGALYNSLTGTSTPTTENSRDRVWDLEGHFGSSFVNTSVHGFDYYGGLGFWFLTNKIDGEGSYTREIMYIYLPLGIQYTARLGESFRLTTGAQYNQLIIGTVKSKFSDVNSNSDDLSNTQSTGKGFKLNLAGEWNVRPMTLFVAAYFQSWDIAQSDTGYVSGLGYVVEPHNTTKMLGFNLGGRF